MSINKIQRKKEYVLILEIELTLELKESVIKHNWFYHQQHNDKDVVGIAVDRAVV